MRITINGQWLDMPSEDVSVSWRSLRFAGLLADPYSTDVELPLTKRNIQLLDVWCVLDRPSNPHRVACQVVTSIATYDGYVYVQGVGRDTITVTVMERALPSTLASKVGDLLTDDGTTIVDWHDQSLEASGSRESDVTLTLYDYGIDIGSAPSAVFYPNIHVNALLDMLSTACGVGIDHLPQDFRLLGTRAVVCPQNEWLAVRISSQLYSTGGLGWTNIPGLADIHGEHTCFDFIEAEDPNTQTKYTRITANRACNVDIDFGIGGTMSYRNLDKVELRKNSTMLSSLYINSAPQFDTAGVSLDEGDYIEVVYSVQDGDYILQSFLKMKVMDYAITADDYDKPAPYVTGAIPVWTGWQNDISYNYYGMICNLPEMTVRDLLCSLAWKVGKKIRVVGNAITFVNADSVRDIRAMIQTANLTTDRLGRTNRFVSADDVTLKEWRIDNDNLEDDVVVNKSMFLSVGDTQNALGEMARVPQYAWDEGGDGTTTLKVTEVNHPVLLQCVNYTLKAWKAVYTLGMESITRVMEIEAVTDEDVSQLDYVRIEGHDFMLIDGDKDETSGLTIFRALLISRQ